MDELDRRLSAAAESLRREVDGIEVPHLVDGRPAAKQARNRDRSAIPLVAAAVLVAVFTVGAFLVARRPADDIVLTEPASTPPASTTGSTVPATSPSTSAATPLPPADPIAPLVSDLEPRPLTPIAPVARGDAFTEPDFGTTVTKLSDAETGAVIAPASSTSQVYNADGSLLLLYRTGVVAPGHIIVDPTSGEIVDTLDLSSATDIEDIAWDATDPNLLRYLDSSLAAFVEVEVGGDTTVHPIPGECDAADFGDVAGASAGRNSLMAIACRTGDTVDWIAYDTATRTVTARRPALTSTNGTVDTPLTMSSGRGFVLVDDDEIIVLDAGLEPTGVVVDVEVSAAALALDDEGRDVLVATVFDDADGDLIGTAVKIDLDTGEQQVITGQATGYPYPPTGTTIGVAGGVDSTLVAIITSPEASEPGTLDDEVLVIDLANDTTFRLAHHRMFDADEFGNWSTPYVAIAPDGSSVVFSSNFGADAVDTYLISLPD